MTAEAEVWLVRHAQSVSNAGGITDAPLTTGLTPLGREQAGLLAAVLPGAPELVVVSPYARAVETADIALAANPAAPRETWNVQEFTYLAPARYHGSTKADRRPMVAGYWRRCDPAYLDGEGAEPFTAFLVRVGDFIRRVAERPGRTLVFTHGQFIRGVLLGMLGGLEAEPDLAMRRFRGFRESFPAPNASVVKLRFGPKGPCLSTFMTGHLPEGMVTE